MLGTVFSSVWTILITLFIFGLLITLHELGHYLVARLFGVGIREFSVGMGPAIHTWKGKHNDISLRWLPIGGYVAMIGETAEDEPQPGDEGKVGLNKKPIWQRLLVVLAGPFTNILLTFIVMTVVVACLPESRIGSTTIAQFVTEDMQTRNCGLRENDEILEIDGTPIHVTYDLTSVVALRGGKKPLEVKVLRNGEVLTFDVQFPSFVNQGITMGDIDFSIYRVEKDFGEVMYQAFWQPISMLKMTFESLWRTIAGQYGVEVVSGPVGVGQQIGEVVKQSDGIGDTVLNLATLAVLISMSLGLCNLLPLPVLDGGRAVIYIIEAIRGKPLNPKVESAVSTVCMLLLLGLMLFITIKDVVGLF